MKKYKKLTLKMRSAIIFEIKLMIAAHRDCLWTRFTGLNALDSPDPTKDDIVANEGYYGEAFGIVRALVVLGYGYFGSDNLDAVQEGKSYYPEHNLKWWFSTLQKELLEEEGFYDNTCSPVKCSEILDKYRELVRR